MLLTKNNKEFLDNEKRLFYRVYFNLFFRVFSSRKY
jgi:hypothetical protein